MRRHRSAVGLLVLLLAATAIPASARGLRPKAGAAPEVDKQQQQQQQQQPKAAAETAAVPASAGAAPAQAVDEDKLDKEALATYDKERAKLEDLHEGMLAFMEVKEQRQGLQRMHEAMLEGLADGDKRTLFVPAPGGRRSLQFGLPGVGGIGMPGVGGIGMPGISLGSLYQGAQMGANVLRQGAYTAVEMARMKDEYARRCGLGQYSAGAQGSDFGRHLQALLAEGARYAYRGAMDYARDMPCPTPEQRAEWERMYDQASGATKRALETLASKGDAIAQEQAARALLQRQTRAMQGPSTAAPRHLQEQQQKRPVPVLNGADILARQQQLLDAYGQAPRSDVAAALLRRAGAGAGAGAGADGGITFADLIDSNPIGGAMAGGLMGVGGNGMGGAGAGGLGAASDAFQQFVGGDALRRAGYHSGAGLGGGALGLGAGRLGDVEDELEDEMEEDDDDATLESLMGPKRLGESREERHQRKQALRAQRKAARLARKAERKARRHHGRMSADN